MNVPSSRVVSRSFELVYYRPSSQFTGRTYFNEQGAQSLKTEERLAYLQQYASELKKLNGLDSSGLATTILSDEECSQLAGNIKKKPLPSVRKIIPLQYWRWKLGVDSAQEESDWVEPGFDDSSWNELEIPACLDMNRALLLRTHMMVGSFERIAMDIESIIDHYSIWVNGRHVCDHDGYEPNTVELTDFMLPDELNCIAIYVEKKPGYQIGIAGQMNLVVSHGAHVEDLFVKPLRASEAEESVLLLELELSNHSAEVFRGTAQVQFNEWFPTENEKPAYRTTFDLELMPGEVRSIRREVAFAAKLWSPEAPCLYSAKAMVLDEQGTVIDDYVETVGVRTIEQKEGRIYLNGHRFFVRSFGDDFGFAPAADSHGVICPPDEWIIRDLMLCKRANGNTMRIHCWGFSGRPGEYNDLGWPEWGTPTDATNYERIAFLADQLGLCLVWVSRHWTLWMKGFRHNYREAEMERLLVSSLKHVRNHPSIIAYEGLNEVGLGFPPRDLDIPGATEWEREALCESYLESWRSFCARYIQLVNAVDDSKLICPDSPWGPHRTGRRQPKSPMEDEAIFTAADNLYWDVHDYVGWYTDLGSLYTLDGEGFQRQCWPEDRRRPVLLTECGAEAMPDWDLYRGLPWRNLWLNNGRPCADTERMRLGRPLHTLQNSEVDISQAYQGLCIQQIACYMRTTDADGMNINLIADGLAEGNYHKGVCDLYRRAKLGFFGARMAYQSPLVTGSDGDFALSDDDDLHIRILNDDPALYGHKVRIDVITSLADGPEVDSRSYEVTLHADQLSAEVDRYRPRFPQQGLYKIAYTVSKAD